MRGQVSLIVIISVLLILIGVAAFMMFDLMDPQAPSGFRDVEAALERCLEGDLARFVPIAAYHGGELAYAGSIPPGTPRVVVDERGNGVPVWVSFDDEGLASYTRPKLSSNDGGGGINLSIEEQFEALLERSVPGCLEDTADELRLDMMVDSVRTRVLIGPQSSAEIVLNGDFERDGQSATRLSASASYDSSFVELFEAARNIAALESQTGVFGAYVMDIVALDAGIDSAYPPIYAYDFSYAPRTWTAPAVSSQLESDLELYTPLLRLASSNDPEDLPYTVRRGMIDLERDGEKLGDSIFLSAEPGSEPTVLLNDGFITSGEPIDSILPLFSTLLPVRQYRTSYDVESPLILTLVSRSDGLVFRFALEPRIINNRIARDNSFSSIGGDDALVEAARTFCAQPTGAIASLGIDGADPDSVSVRYTCGDRSCAYAYDDEIQLPACIGGELSAAAPDVRFASIPVDSVPGRYISETLDGRAAISPSIDISLRDTDIVMSGDEVTQLDPYSDREPHADEQVIITFDSREFDFSTAAVLMDGSLALPPLYEGSYDVSVQAMRSIGLVDIPEYSYCPNMILGLCAPPGWQTIDAITFEESLLLTSIQADPIYLSDSTSLIELHVPIFDLEDIDYDDRIPYHVSAYGVLQDTYDAEGSVIVT